MRKPIAILTIAIAAVMSHAASAKETKSSASLFKNTVTGKHYDKITLTPRNVAPQNTGAGPAKISIEKRQPR